VNLPALTTDARASHETRVVSRASSDLTVVDILIRCWRIIAGAALVCFIAGLAWSIAQPKLYEASATLVVSASEPTPGAQMSAVTNARTLLENRRVAETVIGQFHLDGDPERLTPEILVRERLQISQIRDTMFLRVSLRLASPLIAPQALTTLVQSGIDLNQRLSVENTIALTGGLIKKQMEEARRSMDKAGRDLLTYQQIAQVDRLRKDAQTALAQRALGVEIEADLAAEQSRVTVAERQLATRSRQLAAPRLTVGEGPLLEDARRQAETVRRPPPSPAPPSEQLTTRLDEGRDSRERAVPQTNPQTTPGTNRESNRAASRDTDSRMNSPLPRRRPSVPDAVESKPPEESTPLGLPLVEPYIDPVYEVLDYQAATGRTKVSALEAQRNILRREATRDLLPRLYDAELKQEKLQLEYELSSQVYRDLVLRFESARKDVMSRSVNIQVADPPVVPLGPVTPRVLLNVAVATAIGLAGAVLALMLFALTPRSARPNFGAM